jgi:hypothetical protein
MTSKERNLDWLRQRIEEYHSGRNDANDVVEELEVEGKPGQGFMTVDELEEVDIGDGLKPRPT